MKRTLLHALLLSLPLPLFSAVINVPGDHPTISAAIAAAAPGDTVNVAAGTYNEDVNMLGKNGLHLIGAGAASTIISGVPGGGNDTVVIGQGQTLKGFTITRTLGAGENNIGVAIASGATGILIENNILTGNRSAIYTGGSNASATISGNVIDDNRTGIIFTETGGCGPYQILGNTITNNRTFGILFNVVTPVDPGLRISGNNITGNYAVQLENNSGASINASGNWWGAGTPPVVTASQINGTLPAAFNYPGPVTLPGTPYPYTITGANASLVDYSPWLKATPGTSPMTWGTNDSIQPAIDAAAAGDTIQAEPGNYTEPPISVNKAIILQGPNAGTAGSGGRAAEARISDTAISITAAGAVIDGVEVFQTDNTANAVLVGAASTVTNSIVRRNGVSAGTPARGVVTTVGLSGAVISGNLFTGDTSGGLFSNHKTWNSAIYSNGGAASITGNTFENCRTALNLDDFNAGISLTGNTFTNCGTCVSFGGVTPTTGSYTISGNSLSINFADPASMPSAFFNNSNVNAAFRVDVTGNTFGGIATASLTDSQKFAIEARTYHRGRSGRNGVVDFAAGQQIVVAAPAGAGINSAIAAASGGNTVLVGPGTFSEDVALTVPVTLKGTGPATTTISGPIGGGGSTVAVSASNAVVRGFTITRAGNNPADWDLALNSAGISIQGAYTGIAVHDNRITGMRTGIDVNNSSGHTIRNNVITNNRTGMIFRNVTDNLTVVENEVTSNWTVGILFLDASAGSNSPLQTALACTFSNNTIAGNWYGGVVDRQTGGSLPAPGANLKNFAGNWWGTAAPSISTANSAEPGYSAQIPVAFGGSATPPPAPAPDILGAASANILPSTVLTSGTDTDMETTPGRGTHAFQGDTGSLAPLLVNNIVVTGMDTRVNLVIGSGSTVRVASTGTLNITGSLHLAPGGTLIVEGGTLNLGDGSTISGTFTVFNSFGSWNINGNTTFNVSQSLALVSEVHVAAGVTVTVNGGGELIFDGSTIDSQTPGSPYNITAASDGLLTVARCVVTDANFSILTTVPLPQRSQIYDSLLEDTTITVSAGATGARVFHNIFDSVTTNAGAVPAPFAGVDGWSNVASAAALQNRFTLNYEAPLNPTRTLDVNGNLFVQPSDAVVVRLDVAGLGANTIVAAEALLGYNSDLLVLDTPSAAVTVDPAWEVIFENSTTSGSLGSVDSALGLDLIGPGDDGISGPATIARVHFDALIAGRTANFFRVQTNGQYIPSTNDLVQDNRLTASASGAPSFLTAFTANSGDLVIDDQAPAISVPSVTATQVQPSAGIVNVLTPPTTNRVFRNGTPVTVTFTATDAGLAGLDAPDWANDLAFVASNGVTTLNSSNYSVVATDVLGVVTYTLTLNVPAVSTTGVYTMSATVRDKSGNLSPVTLLGDFTIANEVLATVELEGFAATTRTVTFVATNSIGSVLATWTKSISNFSSSVGSVILEDVPPGTAAISAKSAWNLRRKLGVAFSPSGVGAVSFTGAAKLPGGDISGDNVVNTLDYSILRFNWTTANSVADINGDGTVLTADFNLLRAHFYSIGDAQ